MSATALLLRSAGHDVSGCDRQALPPISDMLDDQGVAFTTGYEAQDLPAADVYVIGNALSRGNPMVERILREKLPYVSAAALLRERVLTGRQVIAVSGTHGKTTTTALLASMLRAGGLDPGWLIGGLPADGGASAHLGTGPFVIEADEYDTAFFDKQAKFLHYRPDWLLINNLEFDHADIFADLAAIQVQFHRLLRTMPDTATVLVPAAAPSIDEVLQMGCWSQVQRLRLGGAGADAEWTAEQLSDGRIAVARAGEVLAEVTWHLPGDYNRNNLLAAFALAVLAGVQPEAAASAASAFKGVRRRYDLLLEADGVRLYEDFAHHPTAITACLGAARKDLRSGGRLLAAVDLASNTMSGGHHIDSLGPVVEGADAVFWFGEPALATAERWGGEGYTDSELLAQALLAAVRRDDSLILFSNSHFGGLRQTLPALMRERVGK